MVNSLSVGHRTSSLTLTVSLFWHFCEVVRLSKLKSSLHKDGIISYLKIFLAKCSGVYIKWRISKAGTRSYFLRCTWIYTITSTYFNPLYDNTIMVSMPKPQGTKRFRTADMPVDKEASTQGSKKPKPKQTSRIQSGSLYHWSLKTKHQEPTPNLCCHHCQTATCIIIPKLNLLWILKI